MHPTNYYLPLQKFERLLFYIKFNLRMNIVLKWFAYSFQLCIKYRQVRESFKWVLKVILYGIIHIRNLIQCTIMINFTSVNEKIFILIFKIQNYYWWKNILGIWYYYLQNWANVKQVLLSVRKKICFQNEKLLL